MQYAATAGLTDGVPAEVVQTPARAAIAPMGSPQRPVMAISRMITASAAFSAWVKPAAIAGGIHEPAAHDRRRSRLADVRGRRPMRRRGWFDTRSERPASRRSPRTVPASSADSTSAPNARQTSLAKASSPDRGVAVMARRTLFDEHLLPLVGAAWGQSDTDHGNANFRVDSPAGVYASFGPSGFQSPIDFKRPQAPTWGLFSFQRPIRPSVLASARDPESRDFPSSPDEVAVSNWGWCWPSCATTGLSTLAG